MKKAMVYILALTMLFTVMLSGCGENKGNKTETTTTPAMTDILPDVTMPAVEDGVVEDKDGIITDNDNGNDNGDTDNGMLGNDNDNNANNGNTETGKTEEKETGTNSMAVGDNAMNDGTTGGIKMP